VQMLNIYGKGSCNDLASAHGIIWQRSVKN
jgi:hypothetical protein